jgi:hypothetical protein
VPWGAFGRRFSFHSKTGKLAQQKYIVPAAIIA